MPGSGNIDLHDHALKKLSRVIGDERARSVLGNVLSRLELPRVGSLAELQRVSEALQGLGGFEGTIGAMLSVDVAMFRLKGNIG